MSKVIECACGTTLRADNDRDLIAAAQRHAKETHGMALTAEQAMAMARPE